MVAKYDDIGLFEGSRFTHHRKQFSHHVVDAVECLRDLRCVNAMDMSVVIQAHDVLHKEMRLMAAQNVHGTRHAIGIQFRLDTPVLAGDMRVIAFIHHRSAAGFLHDLPQSISGASRPDLRKVMVDVRTGLHGPQHCPGHKTRFTGRLRKGFCLNGIRLPIPVGSEDAEIRVVPGDAVSLVVWYPVTLGPDPGHPAWCGWDRSAWDRWHEHSQ